MHIILTHEQADFDALAALMAAHILNDRALAVLPRRTNRNVRAFLNLYGSELPFIEPRDLPAEEIETITLVDTQSLITLKGMTERTRIHVVDHHQLREDLPAEWSVVIERLGACTTILAEDIFDHNGAITPLQATVLLLGIYEDTGSLSFISTTPRDVRAVANLLEQGASLEIASEFLNPPLSDNQREIYNRLLKSAENYHIHGQLVVIATADAADLNEEISSIAHKLRDLFDPDALFLVVNTYEGVRIVARSTTDRINVNEVTAFFGGGGHDRAAAALIRNDQNSASSDPLTLSAVHKKLIGCLPEWVQPAVTVGKIMSRGVRILSPETPAQEAAKLMQRYGYEGYPVVSDGKVVGLLTRRAVDRAQAHKLNLPAASLMEAGEVTVTPDDPIEHLQRVMVKTGWGQVPVIDPEDEKVVGIVTRTDLLKLMGSGESRLPERENLAARLEKAMPAARLAILKLIAKQAHLLRMPVYIVGGFVRDLWLDRPSTDIDIVVEGDAISLARSLEKQYGGRVTSHTRFGTAKWQISTIREELTHQLSPEGDEFTSNGLPESLDLISARTEFYNYPTALPTVERGSIKLDLHRRDFTINTLALRLDGRHYATLYDYWGGMNDLQNKLVRVLHSLSFVDDPTRILRAVRFESRFGFQIEGRTLQLMTEAHDLIKQISGDRLRHELDLILSEADPAGALARLEELQLLSAIHPDLHWQPETTRALLTVLHEPIAPDWELPTTFGNLPLPRALAHMVWLITLPPEVGGAVADRLRLSHQLHSAIIEGSRLFRELPAIVSNYPSRIVTRLEEAPLAVQYAIFCLSPSDAIREILHRYATKWRMVHPLTDGHSLHSLGVEPGPVYKQILWTLRAAWLDGKITTFEQETALLNQVLFSNRIH